MQCYLCLQDIPNGAAIVAFDDAVYCKEPCSAVAVVAKQRVADPLTVPHRWEPFGDWWIVGVAEDCSWWVAEAIDWAKPCGEDSQHHKPRKRKEAWRFGGGPFKTFAEARAFLRSQFAASLMLGAHGLQLTAVAHTMD